MYTLLNFKKILNLNWKKVTIDWIYEENIDIKSNSWNEQITKLNKIVVKIRWKHSALCPHCWFKTTKRHDKKLHKIKNKYKHMPLWWDKIIELELYKRYFICINCEARFFEKFDFESPFWYYTKHFEQYIQWNWWFVSWNKLAELYQSSNSVIHSILERIDLNLMNKRWLKIIEEMDKVYLWVDEHSFSGHDMVLVITELQTWEVLAILDWTTKEKLNNWLDLIPKEHYKKIKWYSSDMNAWYAKTLKERFWDAVLSVDKYHLFQEANKMVDEVRMCSIWWLTSSLVKAEDIYKLWRKIKWKITKKDINDLNKLREKDKPNKRMQKYKNKADYRLNPLLIDKDKLTNFKWEKTEYKEITFDYFLEDWYKLAFMFREKNTSNIQKLRLNQIFREYDYCWYLQEAWTIKEDFMDAMDELDIDKIDEIIEDCWKSEHSRINKFGKTLKRWYEWIKWYCEHSTVKFKFTNALTEWINNLCKVAKRVSHGFRTKEMYLKKLTARFCLKKLMI